MVGLRDIGWDGVDWIHLAHDILTLVSWCEHGNELWRETFSYRHSW